jgi:hypothetical protein
VKAAWERAKARGEDPFLMQKVNHVHSELHSVGIRRFWRDRQGDSRN